MIDNAGDDPLHFRLLPIAEPMPRFAGVRFHFNEVCPCTPFVRFILLDADEDFLNGIQSPFGMMIAKQVFNADAS